MPSRSRRQRVKADWVYRGDIHDETGALVDDGGSYTASQKTLTSGGPQAIAPILYDSHNYVKSGTMIGGAGTIIPMGMAARAEAMRPLIMRVQGVVHVSPSTWALGSAFHLGFRFGVFEQDAQTGLLLIDPAYNMWTAVANVDTAPSRWANDRKWVRETRTAVTFSDNSQFFNFRFNFKTKRRLNPNECFAVYTETFTGSVNLGLRYFLRTLVADEG